MEAPKESVTFYIWYDNAANIACWRPFMGLPLFWSSTSIAIAANVGTYCRSKAKPLGVKVFEQTSGVCKHANDANQTRDYL